MPHRPDSELIAEDHNTARSSTQNQQISWVLLLLVCAWPGVSANRVEQLVTRKIEQKLTEVAEVRPPSPEEYSIKSLSLDGMSVVNVQVDYRIRDTKPIFNEMDLKLRGITDLPQGAGPIQFFSGFGDTAALMLTVASPRESEVAVSLRAAEIEGRLRAARASS